MTRSAVATDASSMAAQTGLPARLFAGIQLACAIALVASTFALPGAG